MALLGFSVAGCLRLTNSEATNSPTPTQTATDSPTTTPTPSPTPTPTPTEPEPVTPDVQTESDNLITIVIPQTNIKKVALISGWTKFGDVYENEISEIAPSEPAKIGVRFKVHCNQNNTTHWRNTTEISKNNDVVASDNVVSDEPSNNCTGGTIEWEQYQTLYYNNDTNSNWQTGTHTAEVWIEDFVSGETVFGETTFEVVSK